MRRLLIYICVTLINITASSQSEVGLEHYSYIGTGQAGTFVPVAHYRTSSKWYAEARYNYDELNTFSLYAGRTFSGERAITYSITPMLGGMAGASRGGSIGLNTEFDYRGFNFSSQSQYCVSADSRANNYFFSWSELSYQPLKWLYGGVSLQNTHLYQDGPLNEPGFLIAFTYKQLTFPCYSFNTFDTERYFIVGLNWEFTNKINKKQRAVPVIVQKQ